MLLISSWESTFPIRAPSANCAKPRECLKIPSTCHTHTHTHFVTPRQSCCVAGMGPKPSSSPSPSEPSLLSALLSALGISQVGTKLYRRAACHTHTLTLGVGAASVVLGVVVVTCLIGSYSLWSLWPPLAMLRTRPPGPPALHVQLLCTGIWD